MSWKDLTNRAMDWVKEKGAEIFSPKDKPYSDLGNGGASGYYPGVAARQERTQKMAALKEEAAQHTMSQGAYPEAQAGYTGSVNGAAMQQGYTQQSRHFSLLSTLLAANFFWISRSKVPSSTLPIRNPSRPTNWWQG